MSTSPNGNRPDDSLRYGMLGDDTASMLEKLEKYTGTIDWSYLKPHFATGALLYVDPSLALTEVGHAFTTDDAARVAAWRRAGDLVTPSQHHADYWAESGTVFLALVVSPFVLVQPLPPS